MRSKGILTLADKQHAAARYENLPVCVANKIHYKINYCLKLLLIISGLTAYPILALYYAYLKIDTGWQSYLLRVLFLALSFFLFFNSYKKIKSIWKNSIKGWFFGFLLLLLLIRLLVDLTFNPLIFGEKGSYYIIWFLGVVVFPSAGFLVPIEENEGRRIFRYSHGFLLLTCIGWLYFGFLIDPIQSFGRGRFGTIAFNPISMGHMGTSLFLLSVFGIQTSINKIRWKYCLGAVIGMIVLLLAISAGPLIALLISFVVLIFSRNNNNFIKIIRTTILLIMGLTLIYFLMQIMEQHYEFPIISRFFDKSNVDDESTTSRIQLMKYALGIFYSSPIVGGASIEPTLHEYPHNTIIEALMATGLTGGILLTIIYLINSIKSIKLLHSGSTLGWIGILFIQYTVASMFSGSMYLAGGMEVYLAFSIIAISENKRYI